MTQESSRMDPFCCDSCVGHASFHRDNESEVCPRNGSCLSLNDSSAVSERYSRSLCSTFFVVNSCGRHTLPYSTCLVFSCVVSFCHHSSPRLLHVIILLLFHHHLILFTLLSTCFPVVLIVLAGSYCCICCFLFIPAVFLIYACIYSL